MKTINYVIFFGIFFTVYGLVNYYIFIHGWQALSPGSLARIVYLFLFLLVSLSFIAGRFLERVWLSPLSETFVWIGSFWLAGMLYFFLCIALLDLLRLVNHFFPFFPAFALADIARSKLHLFAGISVFVGIVTFAGHVNALIPRVTTLNVCIPKTVVDPSPMHIAAASDIHLGTIIGKERFGRIIEEINGLKPDLVLLPGDIVDEDLTPVIRENLGEMLRNIKARYGVVAVTGNHEYIGGVEEAVKYLVDHGVTVLRDSALRLENGVWIVGREDRSIGQFAGKRRKPLEELLSGVDKAAPVILMDHQPFHLDEAVANGIDLQLSGHTHHGQLWPFNFITNAIYDISRGYRQKGNTHFYVSSGVGTWGPPVRIGNRPEILSITLTW